MPTTAIDVYERNFGSDYSRSLPTFDAALVQVLRFFRCERIYGVGGDYVAPLIGALDRDITILPASNELHAAYAACAQAELEGLAFCLTTFTVGSLPAISAAALAKAESLPVVFISGAPGEEEAHEAALHHTVLPATGWRMDYDAALRAFAGLGIRAERLQGARSPGQPNIAAERFFQLVSHAYLERQPVFIEVPRDLIGRKTQPFELPASLADLGGTTIQFTGASSIADDIARKLEAARAPLLLIGDQLKLNRRLLGLVRDFTSATGIPYATSWSAKGLVDESAPGCLGSYNGVFSHPEVERYVANEVDYVLDVASSVYPRESERAFGTNTHVLDGAVSRTVLKSTMRHERDLELLFENLLGRRWSKRAPALPVLRANDVADTDEVDFHNLADVLNGLQASDERAYVYVPEVGSSYFASVALSTRMGKLGRAWLANVWYGAMGTSLAYARVASATIARMRASDRVVVVTGDGGFHFQSNELMHFLKERLSATIVYMRNDLFGLGKCGDSSIYHCSDPAFDIGKLVEAYGGAAVRCDNAGAFRHAFRQAGQRGGLTLLEIPCRPDDARQSRELRLLNLYIRAHGGDARAAEELQRLVGGGAGRGAPSPTPEPGGGNDMRERR